MGRVQAEITGKGGVNKGQKQNDRGHSRCVLTGASVYQTSISLKNLYKDTVLG